METSRPRNRLPLQHQPFGGLGVIDLESVSLLTTTHTHMQRDSSFGDIHVLVLVSKHIFFFADDRQRC
jgi:hypothetical protein